MQSSLLMTQKSNPQLLNMYLGNSSFEKDIEILPDYKVSIYMLPR